MNDDTHRKEDCDTGREAMVMFQGVKIICEHGQTKLHPTADAAWDEWDRNHGRDQ